MITTRFGGPRAVPGAAPICCPLLSCNWFVLIGLCSLFPDYLMYGNKCSFPPGSANFPPVPSGSNKVQGGHRGAESGFWWGPGGLALVCSHIRPLPLSIDRSFEAGRGSGMRGLVKRNKSRLYFKSQWIIIQVGAASTPRPPRASTWKCWGPSV